MLPRGPYSPTATYTLNHVVLYDHDSWVCKALDAQGEAIEISGIAPDDATYGALYWQALTDGGRAAVAEAAAVRTEFNTWFGADANSGIRKTVSDWLTSAQTQFNNWFSDTLQTGVRYIWDHWFSDSLQTGVRYIWNHWFGEAPTEQSEGSGVQKEWADLKADATGATSRANTAAGLCEAWNGHPPYVADGTAAHPGDLNYWYTYDITTEQYTKGPYAKGDDLDWESMTEAEKEALAQMVLEHIAFDDEPTENSDHAVKSGGLYNAFAEKQDKLTFASYELCEQAAEEIVFTVAPSS